MGYYSTKISTSMQMGNKYRAITGTVAYLGISGHLRHPALLNLPFKYYSLVSLCILSDLKDLLFCPHCFPFCCSPTLVSLLLDTSQKWVQTNYRCPQAGRCLRSLVPWADVRPYYCSVPLGFAWLPLPVHREGKFSLATSLALYIFQSLFLNPLPDLALLRIMEMFFWKAISLATT